jgi:phosphohistidine swiveling domain-containing protein
MTTKSNALYFKNDCTLLSSEEIGGKGRSLAILSKNKINVPKWIILTTKIYEYILGDSLREIDQILNGIDQLNSKNKSEQIRNLIEKKEIPNELIDEILKEIKSSLQLQPDILVAVRSSGTDEDSDENSFAGQLDTFLFQKVDYQIINSILKCMSSAFSERALSYRISKNISMEKIRTAVVIQEMAFGETSGVAFTANPISGDPEQMLISAVFGIGEGIVSGELDADNWVIKSNGEIISETIVTKSEKITFNKKVGHGTINEDVDLKIQNSKSLSDTQLKELQSICLKIEQDIYHGQPQDIEWTLKNNQFIILQSRPITSYALLRKKDKYIVFDNSNVVESYAGVPSPLTYSFASASFRGTFRGVFERIGMSEKRLLELEPIFTNMLGYIDGRMYYNLLNWYRYFYEIPIGGNNVQEFDRLIGIEEKNAVTPPIDPSRTLIEEIKRQYVGLRMRWQIKNIAWVAKDFENHFFKHNGKYVNEFFLTQKNTELLEIYKHVFRYGSPYWDGEIVNFIGAQRGFADLVKILTDLGFSDPLSIQNDLIGGDGGIASMRPTNEMMAIANVVRENPNLKKMFSDIEVENLINEIQFSVDPKVIEIKQRIDKFIEDYGCRCMNELKLEEPTYREDPTFVYSTIKSYVLKKPEALEKQLEHQLTARSNAEKMLYSKVKFYNIFKVKAAVEKVRRHVYYREELRLIRGKYWGIVRRLFMAIGRNFKADGVISHEADIFLLKVNEIEELIEGRSPDYGYVDKLIELRKIEREDRLKKETPSRIHSYGDVSVQNSIVQEHNQTNSSNLVSDDPNTMFGIPCGPGTIEYRARVVAYGEIIHNLEGKILVTERTDPGWIPLYPSISGLIIERGSVLSHSAVVAREMGIPTVVGVNKATKMINSDDLVFIDGGKGMIKIIK